jgi:hypothetical protein
MHRQWVLDHEGAQVTEGKTNKIDFAGSYVPWQELVSLVPLWRGWDICTAIG